MNKKGFSFPTKHWINNELLKFTKDTLDSLKKRQIFNNNYIDQVYKKYRYKEAEKILLLIMTELWFQKFIDVK